MTSTADTGRRPWPLLVVVLAVTAALWSTPLRDIDTYWHVLVGRHLLDGGGAGSPPGLTFGPVVEAWRTTQWASEVLMTWGHDLLGWRGLTAFRIVVGSVLMTLLFVAIVPRAPRNPAPAVLFTAVALSMAFNAEERPSLIGWCLAVVVGIAVRDVLRDDRWPPGWSLVALTLGWAQFHGSWPVGVGVWLLVTVIEAPRCGARLMLRRLGWAAVAAASTLLTPAGTYAWTAQVTIPAAAREMTLIEWQTAVAFYGLPAALVTTAAIAAGLGLLWWAGPRPRPAEVILSVILVASCWQAIRGIPIAVTVGAAILGWRVERLWDEIALRRRRSGVFSRPRQVPSRLVRAAVIAVVVAGLGTSGVRLSRTDGISDGTPRRILAALAAATADRPVRVFNDYNLGGRIQALAPGAQTVVDGRADRFSLDFLSDYRSATAGGPTVLTLPPALGATDAVLPAASNAVAVLEGHGWRRVMTDGTFAWLRPPD